MGRVPDSTISACRRVGLFGGTFDPPHAGHLSIARDAAEVLKLDEILWMPAGEPPHKQQADVTPAPIRLAMVRAAASVDPRFQVSSLEIERDGLSYTVDTLRALCIDSVDADWYLLIGLDQWCEMSSWRDPGRLGQLATVAVMTRGGESVVGDGGGIVEGMITVPVRRVDISSTGVRERVRHGLDISDCVPLGVAEIIGAEGLYRI